MAISLGIYPTFSDKPICPAFGLPSCFRSAGECWTSPRGSTHCRCRQYEQWVGTVMNSRYYCGWKKSCTTLDGWNPINSGINHLSTGAGFLPSTVVQRNPAPVSFITWIHDIRMVDNGGSFFAHPELFTMWVCLTWSIPYTTKWQSENRELVLNQWNGMGYPKVPKLHILADKPNLMMDYQWSFTWFENLQFFTGNSNWETLQYTNIRDFEPNGPW